VPDLRKPEREAASFCAFFLVGDGAKQHAGSRGYGMLRIGPRPSRGLQRPGELLRKAPLLDIFW
jgi:hypothetical protein